MSDNEPTSADLIITLALCAVIVWALWLLWQKRYDECMAQKHDEIFCKLYTRN